MNYLLSHTIFALLCLLPALGFSLIIDDCTKPADCPVNSLGYKRGIDRGGKDPDAPTKGILLMDENDVWVETLAESGKVLDLTSQAIIIRYASKWHSVLTIQLRQKDMSRKGNVFTTSTLVEIGPTDNVASIPMHLFPGANLAHGHELAIQSFNPLIIESIDLVYDPYIKPTFFTNLDQFKKLVPVDDALFTQIIKVPKNTNFMHQVRHRIMDKDPMHFFKPWNHHHMTDEVKQVGYRDFFTVASREIFVPSPTNEYFEYTKTGSKYIQMIPHSPSRVGETDHYRFVGRFIGMAIYYEQHLDISLSIAMYKIILRKPITLADVYSIDPSMYKYLQFILDHDVDTLRLTMSSAIMYKDDQRVHIQDLVVPDGRQVFVTNENKHMYVKHLINWKYMASIKKQAELFRHGIQEIIPKSVLKIFDEHELKLIVEGRTDLDVDDWRMHTKYNSGYNSQDLIIQWFWEYVELLKCAHRGKLLEFVTGSPRLPITGFKGLMGHNFAVHQYHVLTKDNVDEQVPLGLKNMNILILPRYSTFEIMTKQLNQAIGI